MVLEPRPRLNKVFHPALGNEASSEWGGKYLQRLVIASSDHLSPAS